MRRAFPYVLTGGAHRETSDFKQRVVTFDPLSGTMWCRYGKDLGLVKRGPCADTRRARGSNKLGGLASQGRCGSGRQRGLLCVDVGSQGRAVHAGAAPSPTAAAADPPINAPESITEDIYRPCAPSIGVLGPQRVCELRELHPGREDSRHGGAGHEPPGVEPQDGRVHAGHPGP